MAFVVVDEGKGTSLLCDCMVGASDIAFGKLKAFVDRGNCSQSMSDSWLRMARLQEKSFPEVRILLAKYLCDTSLAKEVVAMPFVVISGHINAELHDSNWDIAITSSASACTSSAGRFLLVAFNVPNPERCGRQHTCEDVAEVRAGRVNADDGIPCSKSRSV